MWYFYEDGDDEPDEGGLGAPERDWASEDQGPEEEEEEDNKQDNNRDRKKDKDDKDDKSENDGENSTDSEGESSTENSTDQGSQPDDQLNREDVQKDLQEKDRELNEQKNNENGSKNDPKDSKGDKSGKNSGQGKDANTPQGNNANAPQSNGGNMANKGVQQAGQDAGKELGKEAGKEAAKEGAKEASKEAAKQAGKQAAKEGAKQAGKQVASKGIFATPVGWIILLVIVIIIVLIGTISFFMLMPGQILGKLKDFAMGFVDAVRGLFEGKENIVYDAELAEVANYIEEMGYDLKGEGFVSKDLEDGDQIDIYQKDGHKKVYSADEQEPDPQQGVMRAEDGKVSHIKSDPIYKYIVSDNLCYIIRNENSNFKTATEGKSFWEALWNVISFPFRAGDPSLGTGLIGLFWEGGDIGEAGGYVSAWNDLADDIKIDADSKKLTVTRGWTNKSYTFDLDGWTGRYGKPLEFLLSVHLATQMPDLAMEIADNEDFETMIYLVLHKVDNANIKAGYKTSNDTYITKADTSEIEHWFSTNDYGYYMLFKDKNLEHADDCECCSHINPNTKLAKSEEKCDDTDKSGNLTTDQDKFKLGKHVICPKCREHADDVKNAINEINVDKLTTYTPYISKVEKHWFRDVSFYIGNVDSTRVITNDENYYYETGERWSVYETWQENDPEGPIPKGFSVGDYKLYEYADGTYTLSKKTRAEVDEINQKIQDGDTSVTRLVKKPVTKLLSEIEDAEGNALISGIDGSTWSAYEKTRTESDDWVNMSITTDSPDALQKFFKDGEGNLDEEKAKSQDIFVYKETMQDTVKQIEDGQRFATNPTIKDIFVNKKYYKYDGTVEKANKIMEDRKNDEPDPKLQSKVSITKDSLSAFSMLENMHTLDADYIYKDFKELIVELDYFDKEDLSDKIDTIMTWPLPDTGSSGWPVRKYEKGETYYGTLINSKADLEILREADIAKAEEEIHQLTGEGDVNKKNGNNTQAVVNSKINDNNTHALVSDKKTISGLTSAVSGASSSQPNMSMDEFVKTGYDVHAVMENSNNSGGNYWTYSLNVGSELKETVDEAISSNAHYCCCATFTSWVLKKAGYDLSNHPGIHCAPYSYDWMEEEGFTKITDYNELQPGDFLFNRFDYEGTDVNMIGHIQMLGNDGEWLNAGSTDAIQKAPYAYDAKFIIGMRPGLKGGSKQFEGYEPETAVVSPITGKILEYGTVNRTNEETGEEEEVGFIKIEAMDKYIYDIGSSVRDSGKGYESCKDPSDEFVETRENQNNQDALEREGYDYFYDEYKGVIDGFVLYMEGFDLTIDDDSELKKAPKYAPSMAGENQAKKKEPVEIKDEENVMSLYEKGDKDSLSGLSQYQANEVPNMVDDLEEARSIWKEDAKASAIPILKVGDDWYIKEGTVIGKTCKDPEEDETNTTSKPKTTTATGQGEEESADEEKGNGNYMRLILRNLDDSIVEDIENYFPLDGASTSLGDQEYQAQPGDLELLAKIINAEFCGAYAESLIGEEHGKDAAKTVGYVIINRALSNYGGYGTTIKEQYLAPGQYEGAAGVIAGPECTCDVCIECAEWCLKYDCSCIVSPTSNKPMPRNIFGQSGWCFCKGSVGNNCPGSNLNHCWWCVDVTKDGRSTTYDESPNFYDVFFCEL